MPMTTMYAPGAVVDGTGHTSSYERCCPAVNVWLSNDPLYFALIPAASQISMSTRAVVVVALVTSDVTRTELPALTLAGEADAVRLKLGGSDPTAVALGVATGVAVGVGAGWVTANVAAGSLTA